MGGLRNIEDGDVFVSVGKEIIDQCGLAPADINDRAEIPAAAFSIRACDPRRVGDRRVGSKDPAAPSEAHDARIANADVRKAQGSDLGSLERNEPMVSCKTIVANLSEYRDGDASPEMRQKIERHLRSCHRCTAVYDSTRKMLVITGDERSNFLRDLASACMASWRR
jgi:hypothetical protein